jgi:hypothetical protein
LKGLSFLTVINQARQHGNSTHPQHGTSPLFRDIILTRVTAEQGDKAMHTRTKIVLAAALVLTGVGTAFANKVENNAPASQIDREWAENHGRSYLGTGKTAYSFYGVQDQTKTRKHLKARDR